MEKAALRKTLLERREATSDEMMGIAGGEIRRRLGRMREFQEACSIACYYSTGSEVRTQEIIQEALSGGKRISLPKVTPAGMVFKEIGGFGSVERGSFGIMEPKDRCPIHEEFDLVIVPAVGVTRDGSRLGYGHGYYDRFLAECDAVSVALTYAKQVVRSMPSEPTDIRVDWIVTEYETIKSHPVRR